MDAIEENEGRSNDKFILLDQRRPIPFLAPDWYIRVWSKKGIEERGSRTHKKKDRLFLIRL
jgi:hypothetical protein